MGDPTAYAPKAERWSTQFHSMVNAQAYSSISLSIRLLLTLRSSTIDHRMKLQALDNTLRGPHGGLDGNTMMGISDRVGPLRVLGMEIEERNEAKPSGVTNDYEVERSLRGSE